MDVKGVSEILSDKESSGVRGLCSLPS